MSSGNPGRLGKVRAVHRYAWLWEPLESDPGFLLGSMFGTKVAYVDGRLVLGFSAKEEPWRGILVCTDRDRQVGLRESFAVLRPHPVLPKWLYLPESDDAFERIGQELVKLAAARDPRIGVMANTRARGKR